MMRILGIDPGSHKLGWALLDGERLVDFGVLKAPKTRPLGERLTSLLMDLQLILIEKKPDLVACEDTCVRKGKFSAVGPLNRVIGMVVAASFLRGIRVEMIVSSKAKKAVYKGNATKDQVNFMVQQMTGCDRIPQDAADAVAVAFAAYDANHLIKIFSRKMIMK